jgi:hypothetical protein
MRLGAQRSGVLPLEATAWFRKRGDLCKNFITSQQTLILKKATEMFAETLDN